LAASAAAREGRIESRATRVEKRILAAAAVYKRLDMTSFIMRTVLPVAREVVDKAERIALSERDTTRILDLLENPPPPTQALIAAARRRAARTQGRCRVGARSLARAIMTARLSIAAGPTRTPGVCGRPPEA
jgi:uncharacterized protein (DUF1778 family)